MENTTLIRSKISPEGTRYIRADDLVLFLTEQKCQVNGCVDGITILEHLITQIKRLDDKY